MPAYKLSLLNKLQRQLLSALQGVDIEILPLFGVYKFFYYFFYWVGQEYHDPHFVW